MERRTPHEKERKDGRPDGRRGIRPAWQITPVRGSRDVSREAGESTDWKILMVVQWIFCSVSPRGIPAENVIRAVKEIGKPSETAGRKAIGTKVPICIRENYEI